MHKKPLIIAEVKTHSPFGFTSKQTWDELFATANKAGDIISIHTDPRWNGSLDLIRKARTVTDKPILAKGIHATDEEIIRAIEAGADYVLVVGRIPAASSISAEHLKKCIIEPFTLAELSKIPEHMKVVWNSRNLSDGGIKTETFEQARAIFKGWLCQASNIHTIADIQEGADAVLVGTNLEEFAESFSPNFSKTL